MKKIALLFLMLLSVSCLFAQNDLIQHKIDSTRRAFWKEDSIRRVKAPIDTVGNVLLKSPGYVIYQVVKPTIVGTKQLTLQGIKFRHSYFLDVLLKAGHPKPVTVKEGSKLELVCADGKVIYLTSLGNAVPKGNGERNSSDLRMTYSLANEDFKILKNESVITVKLEYDAGQWLFNMNADGADKIRKALVFNK